MCEERSVFSLAENQPYRISRYESNNVGHTTILQEHIISHHPLLSPCPGKEPILQREWLDRISTQTTEATGMPIYLIPHVTNPGSNDHEFMQRALSLIKNRKSTISLISPEYDAAETKWIISQMALFAGARTHSTIAALSSGVPTLSFAYSIKAQGINRDIFGHTGYCLEPGVLDARAVAGRVTSMLDESAAIRNDLAEKIPAVQKAALPAGMGLKHLVGVN